MASAPQSKVAAASRRCIRAGTALPLSAIRNPDNPQSLMAFVAIGSNLGNPRQTVLLAFDLLQSLSDQPLLRSALRETAPVDCPPGSPPFVNAAAALAPRPGETPRSLLVKLQFLEKQIGRAPKRILNEPRVIDLDLIAFGGEIINEPDLVLPHPRAHLRRFVLQPLNDIAPDLILSGREKTVAQLLTELKSS
jgi:2-amino-4-hydroxy-6-hydroxymethyldihydropteridine diphosphokinase